MQQDNWVDSMATKYSLQEEEIRYLRTIHQLFQTVEDVRMIDLAHCLHEGTGKVSYWIKKLREKGIIETDPKGFITLVQSNPGDMDENSDGRETQTIDISRSSLTLSDIKYLLAIQKLSQTQEIVRGTDLCQELGYSSAAVTNALKKLKDKNCIVVAANGAIIIGKSEDIKAINTLTNRFSGRLDLSSSEMTYLSAIDELGKELPVVRAIDIVKKLGVSKPSVSVALGKMRTKGLIGYASNGSIIIIDENDNTVHPTVDQIFSIDSKAETQEDADQDYCEESETSAQQTDEEQAKEEPIQSVCSESVTEQQLKSIGEPVSRNVKQVGLSIQKKDRQDASAVVLVALMDELRRRYPTGTYVTDMRTLKRDNPDIPWTLLANNAKRVYGKPLVPYLEEVGILQKAGTAIQQSASVGMNVDENHASVAVLPENQSCDEAEEQARREAEEQARREAEEQARREAEEQARREAEEQARREAEELARREAEELARREAEEQARREAEKQAQREAEEQARREAEERERREVEEQARREAEEQARRETEEQARREAEEQARREAEERERREVEEQARREAEERARREAEEQARREAEERERREADEQTRREVEERERREAEERARREADERILVEKANSLSAQITELEKQMENSKGIFGMLKRKKLQARIDELIEQLKAMNVRR